MNRQGAKAAKHRRKNAEAEPARRRRGELLVQMLVSNAAFVTSI